MRKFSCRVLLSVPTTLFVALIGCNSTTRGHQGAAPIIADSSAPAGTPATNASAAPASAAQSSASSASSSEASTLTHYSDPANGVSFEYPNVWRTSISAPGYFGGELPNDYGTPKLAVSFSPDGNLYAKTLLTGLNFTYSIKSAKNAAACSAGLQANMTPTTTAVNGTSYQEFSGSDAGMCHQQESVIDIHYDAAHNRCLAFERDFNTECFGAGDHKRKLTPDETKALHRHLDAIMQSVVVRP